MWVLICYNVIIGIEALCVGIPKSMWASCITGVLRTLASSRLPQLVLRRYSRAGASGAPTRRASRSS